MKTISKPSFLVSKGDRVGEEGVYYDQLDKYRQLAKGLYVWSGLPDDVPEGYIEQALFDYGCVGAKKAKGLDVVICPATTTMVDIYGVPKRWTPTGIASYGPDDPTELNKSSDTPVLFIGTPTALRIEFDAKILLDAMISLNQNIIGMRQPIAFEGVPGNTNDTLILQKEIRSGQPYIAVIDAGQVKAEVIDLKVTDFTHSLLQVIQDRDAKILTIMGINNRGVEKASGVNVEESTANQGEMSLSSSEGLTLRQKWCEKINAKLGTNFSVILNPEYDQDKPQVNPPADKEGEDDDVEYGP